MPFFMQLAVPRIAVSFPVTPKRSDDYFTPVISVAWRIQDEAMSGKICVYPHYMGTCIDNLLCQQQCVKHLQSEAQCWQWRRQQEVGRSLSPSSIECRGGNLMKTKQGSEALQCEGCLADS